MAYRSDVRLILSKEGFNKIQNYVNGKIQDTEYNVLDNPDFKYNTENYVFLGWNNIKWYFTNSIDYLHEGINKFKEDNISYFLSIVGENYDDYEEYYFIGKERIICPTLIRYFDDEYTMDNLKNLERKNKNKGGDPNAKTI